MLGLQMKIESRNRENDKITKKLKQHHEELSKVYLDTIDARHELHKRELTTVRSCHARAIGNIQEEVETLRKSLHEAAPKDCREPVGTLRSKHKREIMSLRCSHANEIRELKEKHTRDHARLTSSIAKERRAHKQIIAQLKKEHETVLLEQLRRMQVRHSELVALHRGEIVTFENKFTELRMKIRQETASFVDELERQHAAVIQRNEEAHAKQLSTVVRSLTMKFRDATRVSYDQKFKQQQAQTESQLNLLQRMPVAAALCYDKDYNIDNGSVPMFDAYGSALPHITNSESVPKLTPGSQNLKVSFAVRLKDYSFTCFDNEKQKKMTEDVARQIGKPQEDICVTHSDRWRNLVGFEVIGYDTAQNAAKTVVSIGSRVPLNPEVYGECVFEQAPTVENHYTHKMRKFSLLSKNRIVDTLRRPRFMIVILSFLVLHVLCGRSPFKSEFSRATY